MKNLICLAKIAVIVPLTGLLLSCNANQNKNSGNAETIITNPVITIDAPDHKNVKRVGMVIRIKPEKLEEYLALHADTNPGVRDLLSKYNMRNFSIFMTQLEDGNYYEFGYYEYWGTDFEGDMAKLAEEPRNIEWLKLCDPLQSPVQGNPSWKDMKRIFYNY
jgi:L-rhamnose mutarotase